MCVCLQNMFLEIPKGYMNNPNCNGNQLHEKIEEFVSFPKYMFTNGHLSKDDKTQMDFNKEYNTDDFLDLSEYFFGNQNNHIDVKYRLTGVVVHRGNLGILYFFLYFYFIFLGPFLGCAVFCFFGLGLHLGCIKKNWVFLGTGHYICYVRKDANLWFRCDDTKLTRMDYETIKKEKAYMLFYEQML